MKDTNSWVDIFGLTQYIVYQAIDLNTGKIYTGRTRGAEDMSVEQILKKRKSNHHRNLDELSSVFITKDYDAMRGGEHFYLEDARQKGLATDQINAISDRNFGKKGTIKKGDKYMEAFYKENPELKPNCN